MQLSNPTNAIPSLIDFAKGAVVADWVQVALGLMFSMSILWVATVDDFIFGWILLIAKFGVLAHCLGMLLKFKGRRSATDWTWFSCFVLSTGLMLLVFAAKDSAGWFYAGRVASWLYVVPLFFVANRIRLSLRAVSVAATVAAVLIFLQTGVSKFILDVGRPETVTGAVHSGVACSIVAVTCLALFGVFKGSKQVLMRVLAFGAAFLAMAATVFTETRGAMLILPVACIASLAFYWKGTLARENVLRVVCMVIFWTVLVTAPDMGLTKRWQPQHMDPATVQQGPNKVTGVGLRLAWYKVGAEELTKFSLIAAGPTSWLERQEELVEEGKLDAAVLRHTHLHNQWLDVGVQTGWIPMILVSLILFIPLWRFGRAALNFKYGMDYRLFGFCGLMIALAMNASSLADCSLWMANPGMFFVMITVVLMGQLARLESWGAKRVGIRES